MTVDVRGFAYALEPLRRKYAWQLDAARVKLGKAQRALDAAQGRADELDQALTAAAGSATRSLAGRYDPARHQAALAYLGQLGERLDAQRSAALQLREQRDAVRAQCAREQQKAEATEQHRRDELGAYRLAEQTRQNAQADSDWLARSAWRRIVNRPASAWPKQEERG